MVLTAHRLVDDLITTTGFEKPSRTAENGFIVRAVCFVTAAP
jgi:hypothetical protein